MDGTRILDSPCIRRRGAAVVKNHPSQSARKASLPGMFRKALPFLVMMALMLGGSLSAQPGRPPRGSGGSAPELATPADLRKMTLAAWEDDLPRELAESPTLGIFRRTLWGFAEGALGPELLRLDVTDRGTSGSLQRLQLTDIPPGQKPAAIVWMPEAASVWLATNPVEGSTEKPRLFRAPFDINGQPGPFREDKLPESVARVGRMRNVDGQLVVLGESAPAGQRNVRLHVAPWAGAKLADWASNDELPFARGSYELVTFPGLAVIVGGGPEAGSREEMADARLNLAARFNYPFVGEFRTGVLPLPRPVSHVSAICAGTHAVATADYAMLAKDDPQTSLTLLATNDIGEGTSTNWRMVRMDEPTRRGARLLLNQTDSQLLLLGGRTADGKDANTVVAFPCPDFATTPSPQQLEEADRRRMLEVARRRIPELGTENVRKAALERGRYIVTFFPGEGAPGDEATELLASSRAFRSMTENTYVNRIAAANDKGTSSKFGVTKFPALVLHTANGRVLAVHEGAVPTMEDVFRVTAPSRDPAGAHPDTTAGPN